MLAKRTFGPLSLVFFAIAALLCALPLSAQLEDKSTTDAVHCLVGPKSHGQTRIVQGGIEFRSTTRDPFFIGNLQVLGYGRYGRLKKIVVHFRISNPYSALRSIEVTDPTSGERSLCRNRGTRRPNQERALHAHSISQRVAASNPRSTRKRGLQNHRPHRHQCRHAHRLPEVCEHLRPPRRNIYCAKNLKATRRPDHHTANQNQHRTPQRCYPPEPAPPAPIANRPATAAMGQTCQWKYSPGGTGRFRNLAVGSALSGLRFGDFDGDGKTDVFAVKDIGGGAFQWMYSPGGTGRFRNLAVEPCPLWAAVRRLRWRRENQCFCC